MTHERARGGRGAPRRRGARRRGGARLDGLGRRGPRALAHLRARRRPRRSGASARWYELFPRSFGGFAGVEAALPRLAELGFDVVYLPPIHPIGRSGRKGRNNTLPRSPDDPGSPWAIGARGGRPQRGPPRARDARRLRPHSSQRARELGLEIALDFAIQCSPDHPWLTEHPEWFRRRPDGTIKYAENPPKRYEDIVNVDLESEDWRGPLGGAADVVHFWIGHGVTVFRVDNPHTKPLPFWEWADRARSRREHPEVVFLAEAFTRPAMMQALAKVGFSQSYTYFTWRNTQGASSIEYIDRARDRERRLLPAELLRQHAGHPPRVPPARRPAGVRRRGSCSRRRSRRATASTRATSAARTCRCEPGSEEYLDSEKYEVEERRDRRPAAAAHRAPERDPPRRTGRSSASTTSRSSRRRTTA